MPKHYQGEGHGPPTVALQAALEQAWQNAKKDGQQGKELRVAEWYVRGENPINWAKIVLSAD